ncbi:addiction module toxin RelE [Salmonella enterica subsp. enterica serovar Java]|uniref:type II toxin-antitoxin system RelE/ParE family toxin n=1 Tax=Klebsiella pneumoniae TaxID=573 RepID=UPI0012726C76|nr:type II toxin-antitoxin system RelE/ParE family toxin [Klebsiella pneumoniae]EAR4290126.1 addiction module toxin RelE [Salmonella enterica]ECF7393845.1 addiction module toxin RelE [Salmonella enterica subsp. enterica]EDU9301401.1 addiction module toxin RelE [Salmonella enterica subsp. enterica serovar Java]EHJ5634771.1 type II toxin-antitoxin system RelE/ParE family toxin [Salmonella enterica subsp. enterica serovar Weltevreden]EJT0755510.1 type II toxin-antitoxin system RelE/ParE family to
MEYLEFVETTVFTRECKSLLTDDEYKEFQTHLLLDPEAGSIIVGTGGCRKVRWARQGTGKSSGIRAIYYYYNPAGRLYMLLVYPKSEKDSLSAAEKNQLKAVVSVFKES